jgi:predicted dehydrogenase
MTFPKTLPASRVPPSQDAPSLRWGILGSGWIAERFVDSVTAHTQQKIAAVGSRTLASAQKFADGFSVEHAFGSYEELVAAPDLDVIYVATPHNLHFEHVCLALEAGKNVLVEKPMALDRDQAAQMVALARQKGLFLAEALWTYFLPKFDVIEQVLEQGILGEIRAVYTEYGEYYAPGHRIFDAGLAGGPLLDLGTYPVSLITKLLGVPANVVGLKQQHPQGVHSQLAVAMADSAGNQATMATSLYGFTPTNAAIIGTEGTMRFGSEFNLPGPFQVISADGQTVLNYEEPIGRHFEGLHFEAAAVARAIHSGRIEALQRPLSASIDTMETLDKIRHAVGIDFSSANTLQHT